MSTHPDPIDFANLNTESYQARSNHDPMSMRPNVTEHFWGYEVRPNEKLVNISVLLRAIYGFLTVATLIASLGVWLLPATVFGAQALVTKMTVSLLLICAAWVLARVVARGSCVRVQIDTAVGEVREVVDGLFQRDIVLAHYGFDAIDAVDVIAARSSASFGQVQISIKGIGPVPVGDGSPLLIAALRSRLASEFGLENVHPVREAVWGGPLSPS
jgi:hypothetical protein